MCHLSQSLVQVQPGVDIIRTNLEFLQEQFNSIAAHVMHCTGQGLGHRLVRTLKEEVLRRGKVPFYGTSESHTLSQTVGLKAGFVPAWTEIYVE